MVRLSNTIQRVLGATCRSLEKRLSETTAASYQKTYLTGAKGRNALTKINQVEGSSRRFRGEGGGLKEIDSEKEDNSKIVQRYWVYKVSMSSPPRGNANLTNGASSLSRSV